MIAAIFDLDLRQSDVPAAHLHRYIDVEVYMEPPSGYGDRDSVWKPLKAFMQTERIWHDRLMADMEEVGYMQYPKDHAVLRIGGSTRILGRRRDGYWVLSTTRPCGGDVLLQIRRGELLWTPGNYDRNTGSISESPMGQGDSQRSNPNASLISNARSISLTRNCRQSTSSKYKLSPSTTLS